MCPSTDGTINAFAHTHTHTHTHIHTRTHTHTHRHTHTHTRTHTHTHAHKHANTHTHTQAHTHTHTPTHTHTHTHIHTHTHTHTYTRTYVHARTHTQPSPVGPLLSTLAHHGDMIPNFQRRIWSADPWPGAQPHSPAQRRWGRRRGDPKTTHQTGKIHGQTSAQPHSPALRQRGRRRGDPKTTWKPIKNTWPDWRPAAFPNDTMVIIVFGTEQQGSIIQCLFNSKTVLYHHGALIPWLVCTLALWCPKTMVLHYHGATIVMVLEYNGARG